ncbi:MAG: hypothetical protein SCI25_03165 [Desulfuromonadales bacterium]|nr:hypothetical protein [Desulfuromonadales bacterium]MDW7757405.1 hypothetical protein [Desulfuromonadales bacterium]
MSAAGRTAGLRSLFILALGIIWLTARPLPAATYEPPPTAIQALFGAAVFHDDSLTFREESTIDPDTSKETDLSQMPMLGFVAQYALAGQNSQAGFEGGLLFGWRSRSTSLTSNLEQTSVRIETSLWLLDLSMGLYASHVVADRLRLSLGAGPLLLFATYDGETEETDSQGDTATTDTSENAFGIGGYARAAVEYRLPDGAFMGIGLRGVTSTLEFEKGVDSSGLEGVQGFISYTRPF